ncbi:MAG: thioredoxin domain-containing protein [Terracidiphilus sp.]
MRSLFDLFLKAQLRWRKCIWLRRAVAMAALLAAAGGASLQFAAPAPETQARDTSALHPPAGARVAIVEFDDLECPACAHANPILKGAAEKYRIPWVRHDFIIPTHIWSRNAAIYARRFDTKSQALGDEYRDEVFANQTYIYNLGMLSQFTQKFAASHGVTLPFAVDPQNKLAAEVQADSDLARRTGITQTPTVFIVTANSKGAPFIQVKSVDQDLYQDIDRALADTRGK